MRFRRTMTGVALASMLGAQLVPAVAYAENPMGYRVLSVEQAARLPNKSGALGACRRAQLPLRPAYNGAIKSSR